MVRRFRPVLLSVALLLIAGVAAVVVSVRPDKRADLWISAPVDRGPVVVTIGGIGFVEGGAAKTRLISTLLPDSDLERIMKGQPVIAQVDAWPGRELKGTITDLQNRQGRFTRVVVTLAPQEPDLVTGSRAWVRIITDRRDNALRVPYAALLFNPDDIELHSAHGVDRRAFAGQALSEFVDHLKRDVTLDPQQSADLDRAASELSDSATAGLGPDTDPATRRERMQALRRGLITRIEPIIRPDQQPQFQDFLDKRAKRSRERGHAGRIFVLHDDGQVEPQAVRVGAVDGQHAELIGAPLEAGARVVIGQMAARSAKRPMSETLLSFLPKGRP